jgi:hypothetical protein
MAPAAIKQLRPPGSVSLAFGAVRGGPLPRRLSSNAELGPAQTCWSRPFGCMRVTVRTRSVSSTPSVSRSWNIRHKSRSDPGRVHTWSTKLKRLAGLHTVLHVRCVNAPTSVTESLKLAESTTGRTKRNTAKHFCPELCIQVRQITRTRGCDEHEWYGVGAQTREQCYCPSQSVSVLTLGHNTWKRSS